MPVDSLNVFRRSLLNNHYFQLFDLSENNYEKSQTSGHLSSQKIEAK